MRLSTFNILHGRTLDDGVVSADRLAEAVRILDPDVLALQEVDRQQPRSHRLDLTSVAAEAMGAFTHRFVAALAGTPGTTWTAAGGADVAEGAAYGIALLSRYPVTSWLVLQLPRLPFRIPWWLPDARRPVMVHDEPRSAVIAQLLTPMGPLVVANTHLSYVPGWRSVQLRRLSTELATLPGPAVVLGDLNMAAEIAERSTGLRSLARHRTFPARHPVRQIDHILARGDVGRVVASSAPVLPLSDHRALVVEVVWERDGVEDR